MTLDPTKPATRIVVPDDLALKAIAQAVTAYRREIEEIPSEKFLTVIAVQTPEPMSPETFFALFGHLRSDYGVENIETLFDGRIPDYGGDYRVGLQLTAHLVPVKRPAPEPEKEETV